MPEVRAAERFLWIDVLRACAIFPVIAVHARQHVFDLPSSVVSVLDYGGWGVRLFFVISAISLCFSYERRLSEKFAIRNFYLRRFFRIAPAYYFAILLYAAWGALNNAIAGAGLQVPPPYTPINILANVIFVHGFYEPANNNIVPGGWSIGSEMAFYAVFPFAWLLLRKFSVGLLCAIAVVGSVISFFYVVPRVDVFLHFSIFAQMTIFMVGMIAYKIIISTTPPNLPSLFVLGVATVGIYSVMQSDAFAATFLVAMLFLMMAVIAAQSVKPGALSLLFGRIGRASYSMYIFHFLVLDVTTIIANRLQLATVLPPVLMFVLLFMTVCFVTYRVALWSLTNLENPGIALGEAVIRRVGRTGAAAHRLR